MTITRRLLVATIAVISFVGYSGYASQDAGSVVLSPPVKSTLAAPIYVAGYSIRTTNAKEAGGDGEIGKLWANFYQDNLGAAIPHRIGQNLMVVYSDYSNDEKGEYTYLLGAPVDSIEGLPKDITYRKIPAGAYSVVTTSRGPLQQVIPAAWRQIWAMPPAKLGGKRAFLFDYEVYDQENDDPSNGQVEIHLSLLPETPSK